MDVKKIGRIPNGGGWRAHGRQAGSTSRDRKRRVGFDFVHSLVDDHSRLAYSEILDDEKAATCAGFLARAVGYFAAFGIDRIEALMTDNHWSYTRSNALATHLEMLGAKHVLIRPHCPWQNGKVERSTAPCRERMAYRRVFHTNAERTEALDLWLETYNTQRRHSALGGLPPISRLPSPT